MNTDAAMHDGWIAYRGAQRDIFATGCADRSIMLSELANAGALHGLGPCEHLDGEITLLHGRPYVSKVRNGGCVIEHGFDHGAIFLVWTQHDRWLDVPVPAAVASYPELQAWLREAAQAHDVDPSHAFPFLLSGVVARLNWHINVDRTDGEAITRELFQKSKQSYVLTDETVEILGFYSERHHGIFIGEYAPALDLARGEKNCMHIHFVSASGQTSGHIDDLRLDGRVTLRLPAR